MTKKIVFAVLFVAAICTAAYIKHARAQFQPCVWPNTCSDKVVTTFEPCVWPNTCSDKCS